MKKSYQVLGLVGALLWCIAILVRGLHIVLPFILPFFVQVMPNVGVLWLGMGIFVTFFAKVFHREPSRRHRYWVMAAMLGVLLLSEIIHAAFLGAGFDWHDMWASIVAMLPLVGIHAFAQKRGAQ